MNHHVQIIPSKIVDLANVAIAEFLGKTTHGFFWVNLTFQGGGREHTFFVTEKMDNYLKEFFEWQE